MSFNSTFGFAAKAQYRTDAESGLLLLGHRYYDPSVGRFISQDPAQDESNWYAYCGNNPLVATDPTGLKIEIHGTKKQKQEFKKAKEHLMKKSTAFKHAYKVLDGSSATYTINLNYDGENSFEPNSDSNGNSLPGGKINWDPHLAMGVVDDSNNATGFSQSPATGLLHEAAHASFYDKHRNASDDLFRKPAGVYTNQEERRVILYIEGPWAKKSRGGRPLQPLWR